MLTILLTPGLRASVPFIPKEVFCFALFFSHWLWRLFKITLFYLGLCQVAHGILVPWPRIEPMPPALGARSLNHWTTSEVPEVFFKTQKPLLPSKDSSSVLLTECYLLLRVQSQRTPMWTLRAVGGKAELYFFFKLINEFLFSGSSYLFLA